MKTVALCFSGAIASGKTTVSREVADALGWGRASFGDHIRDVARSRQMSLSRETLQRLGQEAIETEGWDGLCRLVLSRAGWVQGAPLVIDGIRHAEAITTLRALMSPVSVLLVHLDVGESVRAGRLEQRGDSSVVLSPEVKQHSTETQVYGVLPSLADLLIDADTPINEIVTNILKWIAK